MKRCDVSATLFKHEERMVHSDLPSVSHRAGPEVATVFLFAYAFPFLHLTSTVVENTKAAE
jgi:hypothetical protein